MRPLLLLLLACRPDPARPAPKDGGADGAAADSGADGVPVDSGGGADGGDSDPPAEDADGDGYPAWTGSNDPALADCNDGDPTVTPATERLIPAGPFWRGSEEDPEAAPVRQIELSAYCIDTTEVTNQDFVIFLEQRAAAGRPNQDEFGNPLFDFDDADDEIPSRILERGSGYTIMEGYDEHPVVEVWVWSGDAYCGARGKALPTEAQWEKAARGAEDQREWPWGEELQSCELANLRPGTSGPDGADPCMDDSMPVGSYPEGASPYGVLDLTGNVAEWVSDYFDPSYYAESPEVDPTGPDDPPDLEFPEHDPQPARTARGGNFRSDQRHGKVYSRTQELEDGSSNGLGFRCVRTL